MSKDSYNWVVGRITPAQVSLQNPDNAHRICSPQDSDIVEAGPPLEVQRLRNVDMPAYASRGAACFDLTIGALLSTPQHAPVDGPGDDDMGIEFMPLAAGRQVWVGTGIAVRIPDRFGLMIVPRSGHGAKRGLVLGNGTAVIDSDYRSEIKLALLNRGYGPTIIERDMRVAQAWLLPAPQASISEVDSVEATGRGGFGSTS